MLKLDRMRPRTTRVLTLDAGARIVRLLLAESEFGKVRVRRQERIDLNKEGVVSAEEIRTQLTNTIQEWGQPPVALVLPQHVTISQMIDLPVTPEGEVQKLIEKETIKLSGVSESKIVYDFVRIEAPTRSRQQFWVTLCRETDIRERIAALGLREGELCEVTTTANALIAAYRAAHPAPSNAILVHLGAQSTVVVILLGGQGAFATSFQMGGDFFTRALANLRNCPEAKAELIKRETNLLEGPEADPEFATVVDGWVAELKRQLEEWFESNAEAGLKLSSFELAASGGALEQPGLLKYLQAKTGLKFGHWPDGEGSMVCCANGYEVAFGAALQALGQSQQPVSLLPEDYRIAWRRRLSRHRLEVAGLVLAGLCALLLGLGTWHKTSTLQKKSRLLAKVNEGLEAVQANQALAAELSVEYEMLRPVFAHQQNTLDTLQTLSLLQDSRSNRTFWYVLVADQHSYFNPPASMNPTNRVPRTNLTAAATSPAPAFADFPFVPLPDAAPAKPGLIAELCVPGESETARRTLSQLVNDLNQLNVFSKVDLLSDDLRRNLADPKVLVADRHFVLALDFAETSFQAGLRKAPTSRPGPKRPSRPADTEKPTGGSL